MQAITLERLGWVLWPSFLAACVAEMAFFAVFDPVELHAFGAPNELGRMAVYTVGFFAFWAVAATSSALTVILASMRPRN
jgi:hypothetical protein